MPLPEAATIEIIEYTDDPDPKVIIPNEIRINGKSVLAPADHPVIVHQVTAGGGDVVQVTLTLFAKRVTFGHQAKGDE